MEAVVLKKKAITSGKVVSGYSELLKYLSFFLGVLQKLIIDYLTEFRAQNLLQAFQWEEISVFCTSHIILVNHWCLCKCPLMQVW